MALLGNVKPKDALKPIPTPAVTRNVANKPTIAKPAVKAFTVRSSKKPPVTSRFTRPIPFTPRKAPFIPTLPGRKIIPKPNAFVSRLAAPKVRIPAAPAVSMLTGSTRKENTSMARPKSSVSKPIVVAHGEPKKGEKVVKKPIGSNDESKVARLNRSRLSTRPPIANPRSSTRLIPLPPRKVNSLPTPGKPNTSRISNLPAPAPPGQKIIPKPFVSRLVAPKVKITAVAPRCSGSTALQKENTSMVKPKKSSVAKPMFVAQDPKELAAMASCPTQKENISMAKPKKSSVAKPIVVAQKPKELAAVACGSAQGDNTSMAKHKKSSVSKPIVVAQGPKELAAVASSGSTQKENISMAKPKKSLVAKPIVVAQEPSKEVEEVEEKPNETLAFGDATLNRLVLRSMAENNTIQEDQEGEKTIDLLPELAKYHGIASLGSFREKENGEESAQSIVLKVSEDPTRHSKGALKPIPTAAATRNLSFKPTATRASTARLSTKKPIVNPLPTRRVNSLPTPVSANPPVSRISNLTKPSVPGQKMNAFISRLAAPKVRSAAVAPRSSSSTETVKPKKSSIAKPIVVAQKPKELAAVACGSTQKEDASMAKPKKSSVSNPVVVAQEPKNVEKAAEKPTDELTEVASCGSTQKENVSMTKPKERSAPKPIAVAQEPERAEEVTEKQVELGIQGFVKKDNGEKREIVTQKEDALMAKPKAFEPIVVEQEPIESTQELDQDSSNDTIVLSDSTLSDSSDIIVLGDFTTNSEAMTSYSSMNMAVHEDYDETDLADEAMMNTMEQECDKTIGGEVEKEDEEKSDIAQLNGEKEEGEVTNLTGGLQLLALHDVHLPFANALVSKTAI